MADVIEEQDQEAQEAMEDKLHIFGMTLSKMRDEWVKHRKSIGVDRRWVEDNDQYNSKDHSSKRASNMMTSVQEGFPVMQKEAKAHRSTVYIGLTRNKTNSAEARVADILLPTDDRNYGIEPTPDPKIMSMSTSDIDAMDEQGQPMVDPTTQQPMKHRDLAKKIMEEAKEKAKSMQTIITDQLVECDYLSELRKVIHDAAVLGTGVIKGPVVVNNVRQAWQPYTDGFGETVHQFVFVEELNPSSYRVDPRNVWADPACGENIHHGKGIFERHLMTAKQIRELKKQPGYIKNQLRKVLEEGPKYVNTQDELRDDEDRDFNQKTFEMYEYWGEVDYEDLKAAGMEFEDEEDPLDSYNACVVMINNTVVKVYLNPLDSGEFPYDFYTWEKNAGSCWGFGIPYLMRSQQKILNAAYRQLMDNAGISSGPQIVVKPSVITPADKQWQLSSRKIWFATDDTEDVRKAFTSFEFNSHQAELTGIIKLANELADQETGVPMMLQGSQGGNIPQSVGGMQLLMNNTSVVLRRLVKQFDDQVTKPHIRRYYNYNMAYNDNEEIKGDFNVLARGSSALLVRDVQNQAILSLLSAGANPTFSIYLDQQKLFEKALKAQHLDTKEIFKSDEEIAQIKENMKQKAQQGTPPDPRVQAAQIRAQTDMAKVQAQNQGDMQELQQRAMIAQQNAELKLQELAMEREIEMLKMANNNDLTLEQIKAKLAETAMRERGKKELFTAEQNLKLKTGSGI